SRGVEASGEAARRASALGGTTLAAPAAYGTYSRLLCAGCGRMVGNVGGHLLPGMAAELVAEQFELYASGLLGCPCGHQSQTTRQLDTPRWLAARQRFDA